MYASMKADGVGATTISQCHKLLKRVLRSAFLDELIDRNPAELVSAPRKPKAKRKSLSIERAARICDILLEGSLVANAVAVYLGLAVGARISEILGLEWVHVTLGSQRPNLFIVQQHHGGGKTGPLKTDDDDNPIGRIVPLDSLTAGFLGQWKIAQQQILRELGIEQDESTPIISNEIGGYSDRHNFSLWFRKWCVENGFGRWVDENGRPIVDLVYGVDDASSHSGCIIEWRDAEGWPCDEDGRRYSRSHKREKPKAKRHYDGLVFHELRHTHFTLRAAMGTSKPVAMALGGRQATWGRDWTRGTVPFVHAGWVARMRPCARRRPVRFSAKRHPRIFQSL